MSEKLYEAADKTFNKGLPADVKLEKDCIYDIQFYEDYSTSTLETAENLVCKVPSEKIEVPDGEAVEVALFADEAELVVCQRGLITGVIKASGG